MKTYNCINPPFKVFGVPFFEEKKTFERLPDSVMNQMSAVMQHLGRRCPGARIGFRTNADKFTVRMTFKTGTFDFGMSYYGGQAVHVLIGDRKNPYFPRPTYPTDPESKTFEGYYTKNNKMEE